MRTEVEYQHPPTGCLETLTGGFWAPVVTRKHLLEGAGRMILDQISRLTRAWHGVLSKVWLWLCDSFMFFW